jgi:O-antigen/teichoic acid export membrane protein
VTPDTVLHLTEDPKIQPPSTTGMTTRVVKGSIWSLIGQVAPLFVSLITTPFVIRMLGADGYGVVVLVALIPGYLTFADLGMGIAATRFASKAYGEHDLAGEARVVRTAALMVLFVSLPLAALIFGASNWLVSVLNVPAEIQADASLAFKFASVSLVVNLLNNALNAPQLARLRMDLQTLVTACPRILGLIAVPLAVYAGGGISSAVFVLMAASILTLCGHIFVSSRLNRELLDLSLEREMIKPLLRFGGPLAVSGIAAVLLVNLEKLVLTKQASVEALAYYSVAFTFANAATLFSQSMGQSLVPAFAQLLTPSTRPQLVQLFRRAFRISVFGILPAMAILVVIARPFFTAWAGPDFGRESTIPFYILLCGLFFNLNAFIPAGLLLAAGRTDIIAKLYWLELFPYILITALLTTYYEAVGAASAWALRVTVDALIFFWLARRACGIAIEAHAFAARFLAGLVILLPSISLAILFPKMSIWITASVLVATMILYILLMWKEVLAMDEKQWVWAVAARLPLFRGLQS